MTIKLEFHYRSDNIEATAKYFLESGAAKTAVGRSVDIDSIDSAREYLLSSVKRVLQREDVRQSLLENKHDAFVLYGKVWLAINILQNPSYAGGDLMLNEAISLKEMNSINQMDHGVTGKVEMDIASNESFSVIVKGKFLVYHTAH